MSSEQAINSELSSMVNALPNPMILHTEDGKIVQMNQAWIDSCGYTFEETSTIPIWMSKVCINDNQSNECFKQKDKTSHGESTCEVSFYSKSGIRITWKLTSVALKSSETQKSILSFAVDLTAQKNNDDILITQSRYAAMGEMVHILAHQWKQPVASIAAIAGNLYIDVVLDKYKQPFFIEKLDLISDLAVDLSHIIDKFRDFFEEDNKEEVTAWENIIDKCLDLITPSFTSKNIKIHLTYEDKKSSFRAYPREVQRVVLQILYYMEKNLMINKIEDPQIWIRTSHHNNTTLLEIEDNSGGVGEEMIKNIFDPYCCNDLKLGGYNSGLYICKRIIEKHNNGFLDAYNKQNGLTFNVSLHMK